MVQGTGNLGVVGGRAVKRQPVTMVLGGAVRSKERVLGRRVLHPSSLHMGGGSKQEPPLFIYSIVGKVLLCSPGYLGI